MRHVLEVEQFGSGQRCWWGECSCERWSTGPRDSKADVRREFNDGHLLMVTIDDIEASIADQLPRWDDPDDYEDDYDIDGITLAEVLACR